MVIKQKTKEELQNQIEGFLEYEEKIGKIEKTGKSALLEVFSKDKDNLFKTDKVKKELSGILNSDTTIEDFQKEYFKYLGLRKNFLNILPNEYHFLLNDIIKYYVNVNDDKDNEYRRLKYRIKKDVKEPEMQILKERIDENIKKLNEMGFTSFDDLSKLGEIIIKGNGRILDTLKDVEIRSVDELVEFKNIILVGQNKKRHDFYAQTSIDRTISYIKTLKELGYKSLDELINFEEFLILCRSFYKPYTIDLKKNLQVFYDIGIKSAKELGKFTTILSDYGGYKRLIELKEISGGVKSISADGLIYLDKLFFDNFSITDRIKKNILAIKECVGIEDINDLAQFENVITSYRNSEGIKANIEVLQSCGITEVDDLAQFEVIITSYCDPEEIKRKIEALQSCGITEVDDLAQFEVIITSYCDPEKIKKDIRTLIEGGIESPIEIAKFQQAIIYGNISIYERYFGKINKDEVGDIEMKVLSGIGLPKDLEFKERNHKGYLKFIAEIIDTTYENDKKTKMIKKIVTLGFNEAEKYLEVFKMLDTSISMDVQRVKNELIDEILESDKSLEVSEKIKDIFEKNNVPLTGKIFKVFELLYPKEKFNSKLQPASGNRTLGSPVLNNYKDEGKNVYRLIYKDLINIAIKSGDRSLKEYLNTFIGSEDVLKKFEGMLGTPGFNPDDEQCLKGISDDEKEQLRYLFKKIATLSNMFLGKEVKEGNKGGISHKDLLDFYNEIKKGFNLRDGKSIYERLQTLLYVNGLGYHSAREVLEDMDKHKKQAHERGLKLYNEAIGEKIDFPKHAFLKGVDEHAFSKIINRGITSREYLGGGDDGKDSWDGGSGAGSDCTPFDIDGYYVDKQKESTYGLVNLVVNTDRGDFVETTINENSDGLSGYNNNQYELFKTGVVNEDHYGIRTGIPTTEIDYIIYNGSFDKTKESTVKSGKEGEKIVKFSNFQDLCYEIAKNGYYIPIVDREGNIKFTPDMYHQIRAGFNYMEYYDGYDVELKDGKYVSRENDNAVNKIYSGDNEKIKDSEVRELISENSPTSERYQKFAEENGKLAREKLQFIKDILKDQCGIEFNSEFDTSITGAELYDSGSTGRGTDIPTKDVDLDFTLLLDADDYDKKLELIKDTIYRVTDTKDTSKGGLRTDSGGRELGYQIKSQGNTLGISDDRPDGIPLDLLILKKSQVIDYSSSDAMKEKLNYIEKNLGVEDLDRVRTNVIIMKKLLKAKGCYKKPEGGISGIGVENRISQHHGSFIEALESFERVAYKGDNYKPGDQPIPLEEFKEKYPIYDAGENYKDGCNDNFVYKIDTGKNPKAYESILQIIQTLRTEGIEGIRKIIKEYEKKKKDFID